MAQKTVSDFADQLQVQDFKEAGQSIRKIWDVRHCRKFDQRFRTGERICSPILLHNSKKCAKERLGEDSYPSQIRKQQHKTVVQCDDVQIFGPNEQRSELKSIQRVIDTEFLIK